MPIESIDRSLPESVVSPGIARAISAMAFPWSCILAIDTVGANVGADVEIDTVYYLVWIVETIAYMHSLDDN